MDFRAGSDRKKWLRLKNQARIAQNSPQMSRKISLHKNQKEFTEEPLQERRENIFVGKCSENLPGKSTAKSPKISTTKLPDNSAGRPSQNLTRQAVTQGPKKNPKAKRSHEQYQRYFLTIRGHYLIKQGF